MAKKSKNRTKKGASATEPRQARKEAASRSASTPWAFWGAVVLAIILVTGGSFWFWTRSSQAEQATAAESANAPASDSAAGALANWPAGPANRCFAGPRFQKQLGFQSGQSFIGTSAGQYVGLFLADASGSGRDYQDPTWDDAGNMGAFVYDGNGHIYLAPAPFMNLSIDRLENQTKLYRVDSDSAQMTVLLELPAANPPSPANPHGLIGLFYDCDTNSLYVSSVAGSTASEERGRIFQVDLKTNQIRSTFEDVDAMGIGVYNGGEGKRLYFGSGRTTGVYSLSLDGDGRFTGEPRLEFYLAALPGGRNDHAARITFNQDNQLVVKGTDFTYTLTVEKPVIYRDYLFEYDSTSEGWELVTVERRTK